MPWLGLNHLASRWRFPRLTGTSGIVGVFTIVLLCARTDVPRAQARQGVILPDPAGTEIGRGPNQFVLGDTIEIVARRDPFVGRLSDPSRYPFLAYTDLRARRPVPISLLLRTKPVERSRFASVIYGADLGAGTASSLGGVGLVTGLWGEKTTGYLMGAGAILGAIWGGTAGANDSGLRIRAGLDSSRPAAGVRRAPEQIIR
jgi:hypothetical protein